MRVDVYVVETFFSLFCFNVNLLAGSEGKQLVEVENCGSHYQLMVMPGRES